MAQEKNYKLKRSVCPKCDGTVRLADSVFLEIDTKARNEFKNEAFDHNLLVQEVTMKDYKQDKYEWCECD